MNLEVCHITLPKKRLIKLAVHVTLVYVYDTFAIVWFVMEPIHSCRALLNAHFEFDVDMNVNTIQELKSAWAPFF